MMKNKRFYKRLNTNIVAIAYAGAEGVEIGGTIINVSEDGLCLEVDQAVISDLSHIVPSRVLKIQIVDDYELFSCKKNCRLVVDAYIKHVSVDDEKKTVKIGCAVNDKEFENYVLDKKTADYSNLNYVLDKPVVGFYAGLEYATENIVRKD